MNCLKSYSFKQLLSYVEETLDISTWYVVDKSANNRLEYTKEKPYYKKLKRQAAKTNIPAEPAEILSWIDTLNILYHTLEGLPQDILDDITIVQEYKIPFSNKRADYMLVYRNKILIIEFSFKNRDQARYETKLKQILGYKEMLLGLLPNSIEIGTYVFIIEPEISSYGNKITKWNKYKNQPELANGEQITALNKYIERFFKKETDAALLQLEYIESYEDEAYSKDEDVTW